MRSVLPWLMVAGVTSYPPDYGYPPDEPPPNRGGDPLIPQYLQQVLNGMSPNNEKDSSDDNEYPTPSVETLKSVNNLTQNVLNRANSYLDSMSGMDDRYGSTKRDDSSYGYYTTPSYDWYREHEPPKKSSRLGMWLGIGIGLAVLAAILCIALFIFCVYRRRRIKRGQRSILPFPGSKETNAYQKYEHSPAMSSLSGNDPWEMPRSNLIVDYENKLGSGAFCNVFKGRIVGEAPVCQLQPSLRSAQFRDCEVAVKMLPSFADDIARSDFMQEINFMKSLRYHLHLVSMLGYVSDRKSPMLIVEFCPHGDLLHYIRERKDFIQSGVNNESGVRIKEIVSFAWQIAQGLEYLNSVGCIHRDVAARNVLVADNFICKIADFGLCRLTDSLLYTARGGRLPLKWMAPESLSTFEYSFKSDVWSYGILLWELFSLGEVPFGGVQTTDLLIYIRAGNRPDRPSFCTDEVWRLIMTCWHLEADRRPSFTELGREFGKILEIATENYGYLIPTSQRISRDSRESQMSRMTTATPSDESSEISDV
ncbi:unnamed protein product, partial [Mesorhabditis belari]|uniref:Protein kinase domain-containing protein n=1 Tax=Mesorhabditis belari TaxID=2138241 RepID=A0AAF3J583_9BILA